MPGGSLKSKPTWPHTFEVSSHVGFFCCRSVTMIMSVIGWIVLGLIAGYIASMIVNKRRRGAPF